MVAGYAVQAGCRLDLAHDSCASPVPARAAGLPGGAAAMTTRSSQGVFLDGRLRLRSPAMRQLTSVLNWLPAASLLLAGDGTAVAANESWAAVSGIPAAESQGDGWQRAVDPRDRPTLHALIVDAAASRLAGATDCRIG